MTVHSMDTTTNIEQQRWKLNPHPQPLGQNSELLKPLQGKMFLLKQIHEGMLQLTFVSIRFSIFTLIHQKW